MNDEQKGPEESADSARSLPRELALLGHRLRRAGAWCWRHGVRLGHWSVARCRTAWGHERSIRARLLCAARLARCAAVLRRGLPSFRQGARQALLLGVVLGLIVASVQFTGNVCFREIEPGSVGVRTSKWGGGGVQMKDFEPGLHLSLPGVHKWHSLPVGTKFLTWQAEAGGRTSTALDVRTLDGTSISLSLCVLYRIQPGQAHRLVSEGHRNTFESQARAMTEQVLLREFGRLRSDDFSRTDVRGQLLAEALAQLNRKLDEIHLLAEEILVDGVGFSPAYEKKLVETQREHQRGRVLVARQLEDQEQQTILRRRSEIDRQLLERRIELDREIEEVRTAGQAQAVDSVRAVIQLESELRANADREYGLLIARGEAALSRAKDLEHRLHGQILTGPGGDHYLALQAARATHLGEVVLDANDPRVPNPLDVAGMVGLFLGGQ